MTGRISPPGSSAPPVVVGITGASGAPLAKRAIEILNEIGQPAIVVASSAAKVVWHEENGGTLDGWLQSVGVPQSRLADISAPIASGSFRTAGMVVIPCSMNRVAEIAHGLATDLLCRAADVIIKEGRRLVLVPRESPLSAIHLANLLTLAQLGVRLVMPVPAFYTLPRSVDDIVDRIAGQALAALGFDEALADRHRYQGLGNANRGGEQAEHE